jgi:cytochrome b561
VVASGFVGRYIYTSLPRTAEDRDDPDLERTSASRRALASWRTVHVPLTWVLFAAAFVHSVAALYYATLQR